ncbi:MAG: ATP synthase F1 subunit delta [Terriglobales bacterium]
MAVIEQRYAQALADLADKGAIQAATLQRELRELAAMMAESPALRRILASPALAWPQKQALLEVLAAKSKISCLTRNFLLVAAQRGRLGRLEGIEQAFEQLLLDRQGIVRAEVSSARVLSKPERTAIERELSNRLGRKLEARYRTEPELVGGFVARVGDQVYDGSLRGRLDRLRQGLLAGA